MLCTVYNLVVVLYVKQKGREYTFLKEEILKSRFIPAFFVAKERVVAITYCTGLKRGFLSIALFADRFSPQNVAWAGTGDNFSHIDPQHYNFI